MLGLNSVCVEDWIKVQIVGKFTFVPLHSIWLDHCQCPLLREEKVDLTLGFLQAVAAMELVDGLVFYSELDPQTGRAQTLESIITGTANSTVQKIPMLTFTLWKPYRPANTFGKCSKYPPDSY